MTLKTSLLAKSLIKPFYRENLGLLCFVYYIMVLAVGRANGIGLLEYQYSLIRGMLSDYIFLSLVCSAWLAYALKCSNFILLTIRKPEFSYLYLLSQLKSWKLYLLLLQVYTIIYLPVLSYAVIVFGVGLHEHWYLPVMLVLLFNITVCIAGAFHSFYLFRTPGLMARTVQWTLPSFMRRNCYFSFLIKHVLANNKVLFLLIKVYTCGVLHFVLDERNPADETDFAMINFFFCTGILGHGVLIHRLKEMENAGTSFYRLMPVSLTRRFAEYAFFYFLLFIPELIMIAARTPLNIPYEQAAFQAFFGYTMLLLLNSLQLFNYSGMKDYFKTLMQVFIVFVLSLISGMELQFSIIAFIIAVTLFFTRYYRFEPLSNNTTS